MDTPTLKMSARSSTVVPPNLTPLYVKLANRVTFATLIRYSASKEPVRTEWPMQATFAFFPLDA